MQRVLRLLVISFFCFLFHSAKAQNTAVSFDGINDYIDCSNSASLNPLTIRTMECWAKFNNFTGDQEILSRSTGGLGIELLMYSNNLAFYCMYDVSNYSYMLYPTASLSAGVWYHLAVTWDGTRENMRLYVNGVSVGTRTDAGNINITGLANPAISFKIGTWSGGGRYFNGYIDETRVWSVNRTAGQIKDGMYGTVAVNTAGLIAYYKMNEGSGTTAANVTATSGINGTLTNGPTWLNPSPVQQGSNALNFDGVDDKVIVPTNAAYEFGSGTVECWVRPGNLVGNATIVGNRGGAGSRWSFHMSTATNTIGLFNNTIYTSLPFTFTQGQLYHLAFVYNGSNVVVYVDGNNIGTINQTFSALAGQPLIIGIANNGASDAEPFLGDIDEVRIWNMIRTQSEIQANKNLTLTGAEAGLVGLFSFDQGINGGNNAGLVIAVDKSSTNNHGRLTNFAMITSTSNWVAHSLITLPVVLSQFTATKKQDVVQLQWKTDQEQNSREFIIERSADGNNYSAIGAVAAVGNSNSAQYYSFTDNVPQKGNNYYRLKFVDNDDKFNYSLIRTINFSLLSKLIWRPVANGIIEVQWQQGNTENYTVTDMRGQKVKQGKLSNGKVFLSQLAAGTYNISVETGAGKESILFIVR